MLTKMWLKPQYMKYREVSLHDGYIKLFSKDPKHQLLTIWLEIMITTYKITNIVRYM